MKRFLAMVITAAVFIVPSALQATVIDVANYSFEDQQINDGSWLDNSISGWVKSGSSTIGIFNPQNENFPGSTGQTASLPYPGHGSQLAYINNDGSMTSSASLATVADNTTYTLTVAVGSRYDYSPANSSYRISLLVDGIEEAYNSLYITDEIIPLGTFIDLTASFTTGSNDLRTGGQIKVKLSYDEDSSLYGQGSFDNVRLSAVPEPASLGLLATGITALLKNDAVKRRKRNQKRA